MTFEMIIAVTVSNKAVMISTPDECIGRFDGHYCEDNNFKNTPRYPGVYLCQIKRESTLVFGGDEWEDSYEDEFNVINAQPIKLEVQHSTK